MGWLIDLALAAAAEAAPLAAEAQDPREHPTLMATLETACKGTDLLPETFRALLSPEDITDIEAGAIPAVPTLHAYALSFAEGIRSGRITILSGNHEVKA